MLTTTALACTCKKIVAPAMNTNMYQNPIVQSNIQTLRDYEFTIILPETGLLAFGDIGTGKMASEDVLMDYILAEIAYEKHMDGVISCQNCDVKGCQVTSVSGKTSMTPPPFVKVVDVVSAEDMYSAVLQGLDGQDIVIKSAAVADYRPTKVSSEKI